MKKKLAILIRGQSKNIFYSHKKIKNLDYKNFHEQFKKIIDKNSIDYDIDIFMHTYKSKYLDEEEILKYYEPKAYDITPCITNNDVKTQSEIGKNIYNSLKSVIEIYFNYCANKNIKYDVILVMRYDWFPHENLNLNKLDSNNFNVYGVFYKFNKIYSDDNILITSHENLKEYLDALKNIQYKKIGNLHFMVQILNKYKIFDINKNKNEYENENENEDKNENE